jgi:PAS domain S-box-containing protein
MVTEQVKGEAYLLDKACAKIQSLLDNAGIEAKAVFLESIENQSSGDESKTLILIDGAHVNADYILTFIDFKHPVLLLTPDGTIPEIWPQTHLINTLCLSYAQCAQEAFLPLIQIWLEKVFKASDFPIQQIPIAGFSLDAKFQIINWNPAAELLFGFEKTNIKGKSIEEILSTGQFALLKNRIKEGINNTTPISISLRCKRRDSQEFLSSWHLQKLQSESIIYHCLVHEAPKDKELLDILLEKERLLTEITSHFPGVAFQFVIDEDQSWKVVFASNNIEEVLKIKPEPAALFEQFVQLVLPQYQEAFFQSIIEAITANQPWYFEGECMKGDEVIWFSGRSVPIDRGDNKIVYNGLLQDITEMKQTELKLSYRNTRYQLLAENSNDLIVLHKPNGEMEYISPSIKKLYGLHPREFTREKIHNFLGEDEFEKIRKIITGKLETPNGSGIYTYPIRSLNGNLHWMETSFKNIYNEDGSLYKVLTTTRDVTERQEAYFQMLESEEKFRSVLDQQNSLVTLTNPMNGETVFINRYIENFTGKTEWQYHSIKDFLQDYVHPDDFSKVEECLKDPFFGGNKEMEFRLRAMDGNYTWFWAKSFLIRNNANAIKYIGCTFSDIHLRKQAEEENILAKIKAEELSQMKSNIIMNLNHEIRTPLNGIFGLTKIMEEMVTETEQKEILENIIVSTKRLKGTVESFLTLSVLHSGTYSIQESPINLNELVSEVIKEKGDYYLVRNNEVVFDKGQGESQLLADKKLLKIILQQAMDNAFKFTHHGKIEVIISILPDKVKLSIQDSGIGITEEDLQAVKKDFIQGSKGVRRAYEGVGIGLGIVSRACELLNIHWTLESRTGTGTSISFEIPTHSEVNENPGENSQDKKTAINMSYQYQPLQILQVEDNMINRVIVEKLLADKYHIESAVDGEQAIEMANSKKYDLILMDINLGPGKDGIEVTQLLRDHKWYKGAPVAAVTAYSDHQEGATYLSNGFTHYLEKPFSKEQLVTLVQEMIKSLG